MVASMGNTILIVLPLPVLIIAMVAGFAALSQPIEDRARKAFEQLGCTACHRAGVVVNP